MERITAYGPLKMRCHVMIHDGKFWKGKGEGEQEIKEGGGPPVASRPKLRQREQN